MKKENKFVCIIDCDPGVDDVAALSLSLYDEVMDIKLITTVNGNLDVNTVTRNTLHVLEKFKRTDIPVAMGADKPLGREMPNASFIHQENGMGGYIPPKEVETKPIEKDAVDAMYEVIKNSANNVVIIALGPHTNIANLILKYPEVVNMVNHIYCEGCAAYGHKMETGKWNKYVSFNVSTDAEAFKIVLDSKIPMTIIPSRMGRELANFNEKEVFMLRDLNDVGRFFFEMYNQYWEHGYEDRRIATNDTCACMIARFPKLFKTKKAEITVDTGKFYGRTTFRFARNGHVNYAYKVNKKKMHKYFINAILKLNDLKFYKD